MSRSRLLTSLAAASLGIALLGACSAESLTERAVGFGLEQAAEGDQDIDIDFGADGAGGISISSDEGDFSVNFDEEAGSIVFETDEGDGVINFDEDAGTIVFDTDEGGGVISFDEEDGAVTFEGDDGATSFLGGADVPEEWPAAIGVPQTADPDATFYSVLDLGTDTVISGIFEHSPDEPFAARAQAGLESLGWTVSLESSDANGAFVQLMNGASFASIASDVSGSTAITITMATP